MIFTISVMDMTNRMQGKHISAASKTIIIILFTFVFLYILYYFNLINILDPAFEIEDNPDLNENVDLESIGEISDQEVLDQYSELPKKKKSKRGLFGKKKKLDPEGWIVVVFLYLQCSISPKL